MKKYVNNKKDWFYDKKPTSCYLIDNDFHGLYKYKDDSCESTHKGYYNKDMEYGHWIEYGIYFKYYI